ncbi:hypothetical protein LguiA_026448 [Lonicera macranthoides]
MAGGTSVNQLKEQLETSQTENRAVQKQFEERMDKFQMQMDSLSHRFDEQMAWLRHHFPENPEPGVIPVTRDSRDKGILATMVPGIKPDLEHKETDTETDLKHKGTTHSDAHMSGQISGRVPNQAGPSLAGLSQQNGNSISTQLQSVGAHRATVNMDPEFVIKRQNIQKMIYKLLLQRQHQPQTIPPKKVLDIVRRLEEGLFRSAVTKEEYLNLETLENRLHVLIKWIFLNNHNQQPLQHVNSSSTIGTMIPTPGMPQSGNSNLMSTSSVDNSMIPSSGYNIIASSTINTGSFLPTATGAMHTGSFNSSTPLRHFDQHQPQMLQGDGYGSSTADSSGSGSFHAPLTSGGLMMNNQDINSVSLQSLPKTNFPLLTNQSNLHTIQQAANVKASIDQLEKMNFQSPHSLRENLVQSHLQQQFEQQPHHFQPQLVQQQRLQKQQSQQRQLSLKNDAFSQSLVLSDLVSQIKLEPGLEHHDEALQSL